LDIGKISLIKEWLDNMNVINYLINEDHTIDVDGDVDLSHKGLTTFPSFITFRSVTGSFTCNHNKLKSLKGCPYKVGVSFYCNDNLLKNLDHGPSFVGSSYIAHGNNLISLKGIAETVNSFSCNDNLLKSLKHLPRVIYGDLYCNENLLNNLSYIPRNIKGNLYIDFKGRDYSITDIRKVCYVEELIYMGDKVNCKEPNI
jgi:hypothetical protein